MGININWSNKHEKDIKIAETRARVDMNASNNKASVDKHTNTTDLLGKIAQGLFSLVKSYSDDSNKKK